MRRFAFALAVLLAIAAPAVAQVIPEDQMPPLPVTVAPTYTQQLATYTAQRDAILAKLKAQHRAALGQYAGAGFGYGTNRFRTSLSSVGCPTKGTTKCVFFTPSVLSAMGIGAQVLETIIGGAR